MAFDSPVAAALTKGRPPTNMISVAEDALAGVAYAALSSNPTSPAGRRWRVVVPVSVPAVMAQVSA